MTDRRKSKIIIGGCLGNCVHVAGVSNFFQIAEDFGYQTLFLGPAVPIHKFIHEIERSEADIVAISFRLTPSIGFALLEEFVQEISKRNLPVKSYFLGCLPKLAELASSLHFFQHIFIGGESPSETMHILERTAKESSNNTHFPSDLLSRIKYKKPYPVIRTHFGLDSLEESILEIKKIAESQLIDVISIAPDQPAQESFHRPELIKKSQKGAGGIPIRSIAHLEEIFAASQWGNYPLLRIYSGTQDLVKNSEIFVKILNSAWTATPIFWYSDLDGRSTRPLRAAIRENLENIRWHAARHLPVEINDPHQWGLRAAPDHLVVVDAYLCARVAKEVGVCTYIQQLMFNTPVGNRLNMDLARVMAMIEITQPLISSEFQILKETRAGLSYFSNELSQAKAQLAISTMYQMAIKPDIIHVVNYCEAVHAAKATQIVESAQIVKKVVEEAALNPSSFHLNPEIQEYKKFLLEEAKKTIDEIESLITSQNLASPYNSPDFLAGLVEKGILDAPHLKKESSQYGKIVTKIIEGKCMTINALGQPQVEEKRLQSLRTKDSRDKFEESDFQRNKILSEAK